MPGNPNFRPASVHPFHRFVENIESPRPGRSQADEQQGQTDDGEQVPGPQGQAQQQALSAELADFLWNRPEPGLDQLPPSTGSLSSAQDEGIWRDQLLAEIEGLTETLKAKVARYSLLRAAEPAAEAAEPDNETAVVWIQDALEDVAATALGIEITSRKLFLRSASVGDTAWRSGTAPENASGSA